MNTTLIRLLALSLFAAAPMAAHAADMADITKERAEIKGDMKKDMAKQDYREAKMRCKTLNGEAEDICLKDARAYYKTEVSQAKAEEKSAKAYANSAEEANEAMYKAARERCKSLSGNAKDSCIGDAKVKYYQ